MPGAREWLVSAPAGVNSRPFLPWLCIKRADEINSDKQCQANADELIHMNLMGNKLGFGATRKDEEWGELHSYHCLLILTRLYHILKVHGTRPADSKIALTVHVTSFEALLQVLWNHEMIYQSWHQFLCTQKCCCICIWLWDYFPINSVADVNFDNFFFSP